MNRPVLVIVLLLLLGALGLVALKVGGRETLPVEEGAKAVTPESPKSVGSKAERPRREVAPALPAAAQMRRTLDLPLSKAPPFEELDEVARRLKDDELAELIEEIAMGSEEGLEGWVRSVLYAEWGRRDGVAALAYLHTLSAGQVAKWPLEQATFAVYRGWAEKDPAAALANLRENESQFAEQKPNPGSRYWTGYAYTEIFKQYAKQDAEAAWSALPAKGSREKAMAGLFRGLGSEPQLREYVDRWLEQWNSPESRKAQEVYQDQVYNSRTTGIIMVPPDETIARSAAQALAGFDLEAAQEWIQKTGPGDEQMRVQRSAYLLQDWAAKFPEKAQELIGSEDYHQETLGRGIIQGDPSLAVELMAAMDNHGSRARTLLTALGGLGSNHVMDFFPTPGGRNRLPDFEQRYEQLLNAVEAGNFEDGQKRILLKAVQRDFQHKVPAAKEAQEEKG